jgi:acetoin utilization deacetylase AcuC-like enzyme
LAVRNPAAVVRQGVCGRDDTGWGHPEHQGRLPAVIRALERDTPALLDHVLQHEASYATEARLLRVHSADHVRRVKAAGVEATATREIIRLDADTMMSPASWDAAQASAGCAVDAIRLVLEGRSAAAFALCRPPGHHATRDMAMGFCLFNNVAVAARHARSKHGVNRVLIVDWDVHHGNGTQALVETDGSIRYVSLHQYPWYPGTGAAGERGVGNVFNVPRGPGKPPTLYVADLWDAIVAATTSWAPGLVLVSAGFDAMTGDPLGGFTLEPEHYTDLTHRLRERLPHVPIVGLLEGGYVPSRVADGVVAHLNGLQ